MDEIVEAALRKWPQVPACYGWLALDARGDWYMRDERIQRAGLFPQVKGSRIDHEKLKAFIGRNYAANANGEWYFQNGPQRVYVALEAAPWTWRIADASTWDPTCSTLELTSHTGRATSAESALVDEHGRLFVQTPIGLGIVHSLDMHAAADAVERRRLDPVMVRFADLPARFGYRLEPRPAEESRA
jgi:hypothetical protein